MSVLVEVDGVDEEGKMPGSVWVPAGIFGW